jgi:hypothetical protein
LKQTRCSKTVCNALHAPLISLSEIGAGTLPRPPPGGEKFREKQSGFCNCRLQNRLYAKRRKNSKFGIFQHWSRGKARRLTSLSAGPLYQSEDKLMGGEDQ